ncbi:hypothetical protein [Acinetobacter sp. WZC-1]|uniref:hypothetical protein n=1 Tax=Acinetobacter sp. WZC-1 TaxID=3459034 RepID=UPI00403DF5C4
MNFLFRNQIRNIWFLLLLINCGLLAACQKPAPEIIQESEHAHSEANIAPDLTTLCQNLKKEMQEINNQRTTLAIEQMNQDLRLCLPLTDFPEQKQLMKLADQMYAQFLKVDRTPLQQQLFESYAVEQYQYPTIQQHHFEQLHIRDQYLIRHKGQAYVELLPYAVKGHINYRRNPQYLVKIFAPYLPHVEAEFIEELAQQNTQPFWNDNKLVISPEEIARRALFWENYYRDYPSSSYRNDARYLAEVYAALLFKGLPESMVSEDYDGRENIQPASLAVIKNIARQKNSDLADQARKFIKFIALSPDQRQKLIPIESDNLSGKPRQTVLLQLNQYLNLKNVDTESLRKRDCFSDAICHDRSTSG